MSAPADKKAIDELHKLAEANRKAGDWVHVSLPNDYGPAVGLLQKIGKVRLRPKKK